MIGRTVATVLIAGVAVIGYRLAENLVRWLRRLAHERRRVKDGFEPLATAAYRTPADPSPPARPAPAFRVNAVVSLNYRTGEIVRRVSTRVAQGVRRMKYESKKRRAHIFIALFWGVIFFVVWRVSKHTPTVADRAASRTPEPVVVSASVRASPAASGDGRVHLERTWVFAWNLSSASVFSDDAPDCQPLPNDGIPSDSSGCTPDPGTYTWGCGAWTVRALNIRPNAGYALVQGRYTYPGAAGDRCEVVWNGHAERK